MQIDAHTLDGQALNYAAALAMGYSKYRLNSHQFNKDPILDLNEKTVFLKDLDFSTNPVLGYEVIQQFGVSVAFRYRGIWDALVKPQSYPTGVEGNGIMKERMSTGPTPLIAALRAVVVGKFGSVMEIPDELLTTENFKWVPVTPKEPRP